MKRRTRARACAGSTRLAINQPAIINPASRLPQADRRIPPLTWHSGDLADLLMDRFALHLRREVPERFGSMSLDDIDLLFGELRDEVRRLCSEFGEDD
jgi:hypothetical protein